MYASFRSSLLLAQAPSPGTRARSSYIPALDLLLGGFGVARLAYTSILPVAVLGQKHLLSGGYPALSGNDRWE